MKAAVVLSLARPSHVRLCAVCCDVSPLHAAAYLITAWVFCD